MADTILVTIRGQTQGQFRGDNPTGGQYYIRGLGFGYEVDTQIDPQTGRPAGRRQHRPVRFIKAWGAATCQLFTALATNEVLPDVTFLFYKPGQSRAYYTVTLTNAAVSGLRQFTNSSPYMGGQQSFGEGNGELEEVSFVFQRITVTFVDGGVVAEDNWAA
jgi:type VI secretion system secreted protein Hcp